MRSLNGPVAERLGNGLQNRVQRFESARDLKRTSNFFKLGVLSFSSIDENSLLVQFYHTYLIEYQTLLEFVQSMVHFPYLLVSVSS